MFGHAFDSLMVKKQKELVIEIEVDRSFIDFISNNQKILKEDLQAEVDLEDNKTKVSIIVRDKVTVTSSGGCSHLESPSFKISGPSDLISKTGKIDVIIPGYSKDKTEEDLKPYIDKKVLAKFKKKSIPEEVKLALKFAEDEQKFLRLIYNKPKTKNQWRLFNQMIKDSDYVINFDIQIKN